MWSIIRQFEMARVMGFWGTGSQLADLGQLENMVYVASLKLTCEPDLYNSDVKKQPAETNTELVYVGNTSFKIRSNLFLSQVSNIYSKSKFKLKNSFNYLQHSIIFFCCKSKRDHYTFS